MYFPLFARTVVGATTTATLVLIVSPGFCFGGSSAPADCVTQITTNTSPARLNALGIRRMLITCSFPFLGQPLPAPARCINFAPVIGVMKRKARGSNIIRVGDSWLRESNELESSRG